MKKIIALFLSLLLLAVPALAEQDHEAHVFAPDGCGIALTMDHEWFHALAANLYANGDRPSTDPCEYSDLTFIYVDEADASLPQDGLLVFSLSNRIEGCEHTPYTGSYPAFTQSHTLVSENGRELLIWYNDPASLPAHLADKLMLPVDRLMANPGDVQISEPVPVPAAAGFDALHGINVVDHSPVAADVLAGKKVTMINIWATYCNPCIAEMPDLARLNADYADKGFQIIGIVSDAGSAENPDSDALAYANMIIDSTTADYLHLLPGEGMFYGALSNITAVPTTYFVDENGVQIGEEYVGGRDYAGWASIVDGILGEME